MSNTNGTPDKRRTRTGKVGQGGAIVWTKDALEKISNVVEKHADGWANVVTGLGLSRDKRLGMQFQGAPGVSHQKELLEGLYHGDDLVGRIIDLIPQEMYRAWIDMTAGGGDVATEAETAGMILQELDALGAQRAFTEAEVWARLYGGAVILMGVDDGQEPQEPVNVELVKSVGWLTVMDRFDVEVNTVYLDPFEDKFGLPETYRLSGGTDVRGTNEASDSLGAVIHESRCIRFDGVRTSRRKRRSNNGWGDSVLERYIDVIRDFQGASGGMMHLLTDFSQAVFKIKGLAKALASDKDNLVIKRLQMLDVARSMVRAVPLDADAEEFERAGAGVAGLGEVYDRMMMRLSAATGIPVTLLFGRSPAGMNATGESDIRLFYDYIASLQETQTRPRLEYLIELMLNADDGPTGGNAPESWNFEFNPLWQESAKEKAETRRLISVADTNYVNTGVLTADEVAESRFGGETYSPETMLDFEKRAEEDAVIEEMGPVSVVPVGDKDDAPSYRLHTDNDDGVCSQCLFSRSGPVCSRYGFAWDAGHRCDEWKGFNPLVAISSKREDIKARKMAKIGERKGRKRGRNY